MKHELIKHLLQQKENERIEFKTSRKTLPETLFQTVCAMLNNEGGDVMLGIADDGTPVGVEESEVNKLMKEIVSLSNNYEKLTPPFILYPKKHKIKGKSIIHIRVPASSQIHKTGGIVFDRSHDGDFRAEHPHQIAELYNRKTSLYTENNIYPYLTMQEFNPALFDQVRTRIWSRNSKHPWLALSDENLLEVAGCKRKDFTSGLEGYTLASVLIFGRDEIIQQILPHYSIDAIVRVVNVHRYDDREYIQTNLLDAYDKLMWFVAKHLPDPHYADGDQRISLRGKIFHEVIVNLLVHREYTNAFPCSFVIQRDKAVSTNANNPRLDGPIHPMSFSPFPKNPTLSKFFTQLGLVDQLGSGVLNVHRLISAYAGNRTPVFMEGPQFVTEIPLPQRLY